MRGVCWEAKSCEQPPALVIWRAEETVRRACESEPEIERCHVLQAEASGRSIVLAQVQATLLLEAENDASVPVIYAELERVTCGELVAEAIVHCSCGGMEVSVCV